jgi:hypothetical protein
MVALNAADCNWFDHAPYCDPESNEGVCEVQQRCEVSKATVACAASDAQPNLTALRVSLAQGTCWCFAPAFGD